MIDEKIAGHITNICLGFNGLLTGEPGAIQSSAVSIHGLIEIVRSRQSTSSDALVLKSCRKVLHDLMESREFDDDDFVRAAHLLEQEGRQSVLKPTDFSRAADIGSEGYDRALAEIIISTIPFEQHDPARELILLALEAGLAVRRGDPSYHFEEERNLLIGLVQANRVDGRVLEQVHQSTARIEEGQAAGLEKIGSSVEQILEELRRRGDVDRASRSGINESLIIEVARAYDPSTDTLESAITQIKVAIAEAIDLRGRVNSALSNVEVANLAVDRVRQCVLEGDFIGAADEAESGWAAEEAEEADERQARSLRRIRLANEAIVASRLRNDSASAAEWAARRAIAQRPDDHFAAVHDEQFSWYHRGYDNGLNFDLEVSYRLGQEAMASTSDTFRVAKASSGRGVALSVLAWRTGRPSLYQEASDAYSNALGQASFAGDRLMWAQIAMQIILNSSEAARDRRDIESMRRDIISLTHISDIALVYPSFWATVWGNIGTLYTEMAAILDAPPTSADQADEYRREAIDYYQAASVVRVNERDPTDFAVLLNNLGRVLSDTGSYREALTKLDTALLYRPRETRPALWAMTMHNRGITLARWAESDRSMELVNKAEKALRLALTVREKDRIPPEWAMTVTVLASLALLREELTGDVPPSGEMVEDLMEVREMYRETGNLNQVLVLEGMIERFLS